MAGWSMRSEIKQKKENDINPTVLLVCVVQFRLGFVYNLVIKFKEDLEMNTDKIYAEALASEYAPKDTSKVTALKRLDNRAKLPATIFVYSFGMIAALIMGTGMCLSMQVIGNGFEMIVLGIVLGMIGLVGMGVNYPIYRKLLALGKQKYAFEIMELAKQISEE